MNLLMKDKHVLWILIGVYIILENGLLFVNGQDLLGLAVIIYTITKIFNPEFSLIKAIISSFTI